MTSDIPDPPLKQIKKIIDSLDEEKDYFGISGGEPTLRRELFDVIKYLREKKPNIYTFMVSNGRMFAYRDYTKKFSELPLGDFMVGITLYGSTPEIHDKITMAKGSFEQTVKGIKNLLDFNIRVEVRTIISKMNYKDMENLAKFVTENFKGIERFVFVNMKITGNAYKNRDKLIIKYTDLIPYVEKATDILLNAGIKTRLYHFPLCMLDAKYIDFATGVTKELEELKFAPQCESCKLKEECPMIWKTYAFFVGTDEFKPIGDEYLFFYYIQKLIRIYQKYETEESSKRLKFIEEMCKKYDVYAMLIGSTAFKQCGKKSNIDIILLGNSKNMEMFKDEIKKHYDIDVHNEFDLNNILNTLKFDLNDKEYNNNIKRLLYLIFSYETSFTIGSKNIIDLINEIKSKLKKSDFWKEHFFEEFKIFLKTIDIKELTNLDKKYFNRSKISDNDMKNIKDIENKLKKLQIINYK